MSQLPNKACVYDIYVKVTCSEGLKITARASLICIITSKGVRDVLWTGSLPNTNAYFSGDTKVSHLLQNHW